MKKVTLIAALLFGLAALGTGMVSADVAAGKKNFKNCVACHSLVVGKNELGPNLPKFFGRRTPGI
jgi:cytochrome c2